MKEIIKDYNYRDCWGVKCEAPSFPGSAGWDMPGTRIDLGRMYAWHPSLQTWRPVERTSFVRMIADLKALRFTVKTEICRHECDP